MYYIYCYTNKLNGHKYVGQTNNLKRRIREHRSCSFNSKASSYNDLIHKKIRQYGEENFEITVLEKLYTKDISIVNQQERYWIQKLSSFRETGLGYNSDLGGSLRANCKLSDEDSQKIREKIKNGVPYIELEKEYQVCTSVISSINYGYRFFDENESYPLYKYYKEDSDYDELIDLLTNSKLSMRQIATQLNMGYSTVKKLMLEL